MGKTSIVNRLVNQEFNAQYRVTIGADQFHHKMTIEGKQYSFTIWDTAGQEKFRTLLNIFYAGSDGCLIVFDLTDRASFERVVEWRDQFL